MKTFPFFIWRSFSIGSASEYYRLSVSGYSGNASDQLNFHNGMNFTTKDSDNDHYPRNCAVRVEAGWWYRVCTDNLNGRFGNTRYRRMKWDPYRHHDGIVFSEMKFRKKEQTSSWVMEFGLPLELQATRKSSNESVVNFNSIFCCKIRMLPNAPFYWNLSKFKGFPHF